MNCDVIDDSANGGDSTGLEHKILSGRGRSRTQKKQQQKLPEIEIFFKWTPFCQKKSQNFFQGSHEYGDNSASIALGFIQIASGEPEKSCLSAPHLLFGPPTLTAENFLNSQHIKENFINFCNTIEKTELKKLF